jgi:hypothetical protein
MNTSSIKEIHEHLKHQTHKSRFNPEIPKHRANNPFVILIVGADLVHPKFRSQPRLLARPNSTMGPSIHERKRERELAISELDAASQAVDRFASIAARTPSRIHLQPILVSQTDSPQSPHEPALYHFCFSEPRSAGRATNPPPTIWFHLFFFAFLFYMMSRSDWKKASHE